MAFQDVEELAKKFITEYKSTNGFTNGGKLALLKGINQLDDEGQKKINEMLTKAGVNLDEVVEIADGIDGKEIFVIGKKALAAFVYDRATAYRWLFSAAVTAAFIGVSLVTGIALPLTAGGSVSIIAAVSFCFAVYASITSGRMKLDFTSLDNFKASGLEVLKEMWTCLQSGLTLGLISSIGHGANMTEKVSEVLSQGYNWVQKDNDWRIEVQKSPNSASVAQAV